MIIVDVEASGISPVKHSLLSVGAVDFENPENRFYEECRIWDGAHIDDEALEINGFNLAQITDPKKKSDREVVVDFLNWVEKIGEKTLAGQNPSFDRDFLEATAHRYHINWPLAHRTVDLHSVCYFDMINKNVPRPSIHGHSALNLDAILQYLGLPKEPTPHNALTDAVITCESFSRLFYKKPFLRQFYQYPIPKTQT
jgi:DNA polymerase III epsilon subunit-like protein